MTIKLCKQLTAALLCIAMLLGLFPDFPAGSRVYAAAQTVDITNPGFEDALLIPGWERIYGDGTDFSVTDAEFHSGKYSLKLDDKDSGGGKWMYGSKVAATSGAAISVNAWVKVEKGAAELCIKYFNDADVEVGTYPDTTVIPGDWSQMSVSDTVPIGATKAAVFIYSGMGAVTTAYIDDVAMEMDGNSVTLTNPGFEDAQLISGWERIYGDATDFSVTGAAFHSGAASLMLNDKDPDGGKWMYGSKIDVTSGTAITVNAWVKVEKGAAELCIRYFNDTGVAVDTYPDTTVGVGDWSQKSVSGTVPAGATKASVFIYSGMGAVTTAYIDDVTVTVEPPVPPVILPEVIIDNDCSSLAYIRANGMVEKASNGWYAIDAGKTLPNEEYAGIAPQPLSVDKGMMLFHDAIANGVGDGGSWWTVRYGEEPYSMGNSPWTANFKMRIKDLIRFSAMDPTHNSLKGASVFVRTDKGLYRVVFAPDNKIRIVNNQDHGSYTIDPKMELADNVLHDWSIYCDGNAVIKIACDNIVVGEVENTPCAPENIEGKYIFDGDSDLTGIGFRSFCQVNASNVLESSSNEANEVYVERFSLTKNLTPEWTNQGTPFELPEYSNTIVETDCSSLKTMSDEKWSIDPGENGVYVNDKDNTLQSKISMKSVDEGKILLYHDSTPGIDYISAVKYGNNDNKINNNVWTLKLNMNITELMKFKNHNDPRSGLSFLVFTGTRLTRLTFCEDNKLELFTDDSLHSVIKNANIIRDGQYHNWLISKTADNKLYVTCDGKLVTKFDTDGFAYPGDEWTAPGFQILTYCSGNYASGKTEVYFDDIKLSNSNPDKLINLDFETPQNTDGTIPGWNQLYGATGFSETTEDKNSGVQSLLVNDDKTDASFWLFSKTMPALPGDIFEVSGFAKVLSGSIQVNVAYFSEDDSKPLKYFENDISLPLNQWAPTKVSGIAPAGTTKVAIFIYSGYGATGKGYVDDLQLSKVVVNGTGIKTGTPVNLGEMVKGRALDLYSITSRNTATGEDELYTVSTGASDNPSVFYVLDPLTGKVKWSQAIPNTTHLYGIVKGSDNNIYFAGINNGILFRYLPTEQKIESVGTNPSAPWVWDLAASNDGKIYGATAGDTISKIYSKIFEYDIATDTFKDLGPAKDGVQQARGLGVTDNYLYVGVGTPDAVIKIDRKTMERTEITTGVSGDPERMGAHVWAYNDRLFIRDCAMKLFVMDEATDKQINELSFQQAISAPSPYDNNILYYKSKNEVWEYHFDTNTANPVVGGPRLSDATSNALNWFKPTTGEKAGKHLLGITDDSGGYVVYDPIAKTATDVVLEMVPQAVLIVALEMSPDGKLYVGGYQYGSCIYDPKTQKIERIESTMHQPEGIGFLNGKTYYGTYGSAIIYSYDPAKPYAFNPVGPGNPGIAHDIESKQDRPFALTSGDNKLFVGTIPDYGLLGGALTVYDEQLGTWEEYRNVVQDQSITGLAYKDGLLYGSTSVDGGLGSTRTAEEAKIFVWDVAKKEKIKEVSISIPGMATKPVLIGELTFGTDGLLWGAVDGALFAMNPQTFEVVKSRIICAMDYAHDNSWRPYFMKWGADGLLYTTVGRKIVVFDTKTEGLPYDVLVNYSFLGTIGNDGNIYYTDGSSLMMLPVLRQEGDAVYTMGVAINAAKNAIDMLPGYYNITLNNKAEVQTARNLVNAAKTAGATDMDIPVLSKLAACEKRITDLIAATPTPTPDAPTPTATPTPTPTPAAGTIIKVPEKVGDVATANVTAAELSKAFDAAKAGTDGVKKVVIEVAKVAGVDEYVQKMPADFFTTPSGNKNIEIKSPVGTIIINDKMFEKENLKKAENVAVIIGVADISNLDKKAKDEIGSRPVIEINAMIDGKVVSWKNPDAPVQISIAYTPTAEELKDPEHITVYYIDGKGKLNQVTNGCYDAKTGMVTFTTTHFSKYAISYVNKTFNDIGASPAKREIEVLASKGIINGTSAQTFSPKKVISRADYLMLLLKALDLNADFDNNFSDVIPSDYYYQAVGTAKKLGITVGCGNNSFNPKGNITRQEMLALTARALKAAGKGELKFNASDKATREDAAIIIYSVYNK